MDPIRTLVVDDEALARQRLVGLIETHADLELAGSCAGGAEAVRFIRAHRPELVFLDVQMKEVSGLDVLDELKDELPPAVVFVTAYDQYAVHAFDANAIDYLLKPFTEERFSRAVDRARQRVRENVLTANADRLLTMLQQMKEEPPAPERLVLKLNGRLMFVPPADIDWIEAEGVYVRLHLGPKSYLLRESLTNMEQRLEPHGFLRVHRSTMINSDRLKEVVPHFNGGAMAVLNDGTRLKISRGYRSRIAKLM
ncbi:MAG: LytTR family DNA-binding domain-containing protein [Bacteroidota bacterium]